MKRDMDLIRQILLTIEAHSKPNEWVPTIFGIDEHTPEEISYHIKLLTQAGLIEATDVSTMSKFKWQATCLTWAGHEFLDAAREEGRWEKAKKLVLEKTGTLSFEALKVVLTDLIQRALG